MVLLRPSCARPAEAPSRGWLRGAGGEAAECDLQAGWALGHKQGLYSAGHLPGVVGASVLFPGLAKPPKRARAEGRAPELLSWEVGSPAQALNSHVGAHPALLASGLCIPSLRFASVFGPGEFLVIAWWPVLVLSISCSATFRNFCRTKRLSRQHSQLRLAFTMALLEPLALSAGAAPARGMISL